MSTNKKLNAEEQLLIRDIFLIKIYQDTQGSLLTFLSNFAKDLEYLPGQNVSLLKNTTLFDSLLMERLAIPDTKVFEYLFESYLRAKEEKSKGWNIANPGNQEFIDYSIQILHNFAHLFLTTPELFAEKHPEPTFDSISDPVEHAAKRLNELISHGIEDEFVFGLISKFENHEQNKISTDILNSILQDQSERSLFEDRAIRNIQNLSKLITVDVFKRNFLNLPKNAWIPGPGNISLTKGVGSARGNILEKVSPLGIILQPSLLEPLFTNFKEKERYDSLLDRISLDLKKPMKKSVFEALLKKYQGLQNEYSGIVTEIFKYLLRPTKEGIDYKTEVMRWFSAFIVGNLPRTKLGMRLEQQNKALLYSSSDAMCLNVFDVMLEICSKFLDRSSPLLDKIDPTYYQFGWRFEYKETGMVNKPGVKVQDTNQIQEKGPNDFGTITEFFFHALELCHFCFIPILQNFAETMKYIQNLNEQKGKMDPSSFQYKQLENEIQRQEKMFLAYKTLLFDDKRITRVQDLYNVLTFLLLKWNGINPQQVNSLDLTNIPPKAFMKHLPEHWLTDMFEFHFCFIRFKEDYSKQLTNRAKGESNYMDEYITFMTILLCDNEMISNPYSKAKIVELISFFGYENNLIRSTYESNEVAQRVLIQGLVKFYIDIEFTGASHQFYAKYEYRHYATRIFKVVWRIPVYKEAFLRIVHSELVERFINMVMNDTTYCMDEGLLKLQKIIEYRTKQASGQTLSAQDLKDLQQFEGIVKSVFPGVKEGLDVMAEISSWAPESFLFGDFRKRMAEMLNYFLVQLLSSKYMGLQGKEDELGFKQGRFLKDIIRIYVNLSGDEEFIAEVKMDKRSYSYEEFRRAIKKVRMDKLLTEDVVEQFEFFLEKTQQISAEEQDITAKLGEIPDEFLCPISCDLMKEPVRLPTSDTIMEKSIAKQILLNDEHDPFNRAPLKFSELEDLPELKKKIEDWVGRKLRGEIIEEEKPKKGQDNKGGMEIESEDQENTYNDLFYQKKL